MEQEFDFEEEFEREQDRRLAIHMGDELPVYEEDKLKDDDLERKNKL